LGLGNNLSFFVLKWRYGGEDRITDKEIQALKAYGRVRVYQDRAEAKTRAGALRSYIVNNLSRGDRA